MTNARWYSRSGVWFWVVIALGLTLRFYLVVFTEGTQDVTIWERHARDVRDVGLIGYYYVDPSANHPPFISEIESLLLRASGATGIPFRMLLRAPFALIACSCSQSWPHHKPGRLRSVPQSCSCSTRVGCWRSRSRS